MTDLCEGFDCGDLGRDADRLRALARDVVGAAHADRADDLAQQLVLRELQRPAERRGRGLAWFRGALRNLARLERRGDGRRRRRELAAARPEPVESVGLAVQRAETLQRVVAAALALAEPYRTTILLRYLCDLPVAAVAAACSVPAATVRVRTMRAIEQLRQRLRRELGDDFAPALLLLALPPRPLPPSSPVPHNGGMKMTIQFATAAALGVATLTLMLGHPGPMAPAAAAPVAARGGIAAPPAMAVTDGAARAVVGATPPPFSPSAADDPPLRGRVVDRSGQPVAGASVRVFERPFEGAEGTSPGDLIVPPLAVTTAADGSWSIAQLQPFSTYGVEVRAPGFAPQLHMQRPDADTTIVLSPDAALCGVVRDGQSRPLAGVAVRVRDVRVVGDRIHLDRSVATDADGAFRLDGVRAGGTLVVEFARPGQASAFAGVSLRPHQDNPLEFALADSAGIALDVVDAETLQPVQDAVVTNIGLAATALGQTDGAGRLHVALPLRLDAVAVDHDGVPRVRVHRDGYCATSARLPRPRADAPAALQIRLVRSGRLTGVVRDQDGNAVAGARIGWHSEPLNWVAPSGWVGVGPDSRDAVADQDGCFTLPNVVPGECVEGELRAWAAAGSAALGRALPPAAGVTRAVELVLGRGVRIAGTTRVNGAATAAYVYIESAAGDRKVQTLSTAGGEFAIDGLEPGSYRVRLVTADGSCREVERLVDASSTVLDVDLDLRAVFAHVSGHVRNDDGSPAVGREVLAFRVDAPTPRGTDTDDAADFTLELQGPDGASGFQQVECVAAVQADGSFTLAFTPDPTACYRLGVYQGGFGVCATGVAQGVVDVDLVVPTLAPASFELTRAAGGVVAAAGIRWRHPASGREVTLAGRRPRPTSGGVLDLELPLGAVEVTLTDAATGVERTVTVQVPAEQQTAVQF